tara:strand:- start:2051 stop:2350 length:300 start_codon:yes stop_codon:yes gene_type:complete
MVRSSWTTALPRTEFVPPQSGRRTGSLSGERAHCWRSAVIYTFVEQIRRHGLDPFAYFEWIFEKLMHDPPEHQYQALLPEVWIAVKRDPSMLEPQPASA